MVSESSGPKRPSGSANDAKYSCCAGLAYYNKHMQDKGQVPLCFGLRQVKEGLLKPDESQRLPQNVSEYQFGCLGYSVHPYQIQDGSQGLIVPYCEGVELISYEEAAHAESSKEGAAASARPSSMHGGRILLHQSKGGNGTANGPEPEVASPSESGSEQSEKSSDSLPSLARGSASSPQQRPPSPSSSDEASSQSTGGGFQGRFIEKASKNMSAMRAALGMKEGEGSNAQIFVPTSEVLEKLMKAFSQNTGQMATALLSVSKAILSVVVNGVSSGKGNGGDDVKR